MTTIAMCLFFIMQAGAMFAQTPDWQWATKAGSSGGHDEGHGIAKDNAGNSYVTGYFENTATFGSYSFTSSGGKDIFVAKMDESGNWLWATKAGSSGGHDEGYEITIDNAGNSYVTGYFENTATFGSYSFTSGGGRDIFVAKMDESGNWLWATKAGSSGGHDEGHGITIDNAGNSYVTGYFENTATFGSYSFTSGGGRDIFVAKMDESGNWLWATKAGSSGGHDEGHGITIDNAGNSYVTGYFENTATFGSYSFTSGGGRDIFVAKMDESGNWLWATKAGSSGGHDEGHGITIDNAGNSYVTGYFENTATFGSYSFTSGGGRDIFVAKMDESGNWLWATKAGSSGGHDEGHGITIDNAGNSYVTGYFENTATFGSYSFTSGGGRDIFVAKMDESGNWLWATKAGSSGGHDEGHGITIDNAGNSYVTGYFENTATFGSYSFTSGGGRDIFVAQLFDGVEVSGPQSGTWASDYIYHVIGDINVPNGETLIIEPGVLVEFQGLYKLNVQGRLLAVGTEQDTVVFTVADTTGYSQGTHTGWLGIWFDETPATNDTSKIVHCKLEYGKSNYGGAIFLESCHKLLVDHCNICNNTASYNYGGRGGAIYCSNSDPTITNNIICDNYSNDNGGGIYYMNSNLILTNNTISGNSADSDGGGIFCGGNPSDPIITNNIITNNSAGNYSYGGGVFCWYSNPTFANNTISNNSAGYGGGGIGCHQSSPTLNNNTIGNNSAGSGGGIYYSVPYLDPTLTNNIISGNSANEGGGIYCYQADPILTYNTIRNNNANEGGGIYCHLSRPSFVNVTMVNNFATANGGGIYLYSNSQLSLVNSILWNDAPEEIYFSGDGSPNIITISYSDIAGGYAGIVTNNNGTVNWLLGNLDTDPLFVDSGNGDYHLTYSSPCIDAGDPLSPYDPDGTIADMGAFYFDQSQILNANFSATPTSGNAPLTVNFTDLSTGSPTTWQWDFQNNGTIDSYDQNPEWVCSEQGNYTVSLTVSDGTNTDTEIKVNYITASGGSVFNPPTNLSVTELGYTTWDTPPEMIFIDDFESYNVEEYLAVQSDEWNTWSNTPGSGEDAYVSDEQALSGTNSVKIQGGSDVLHEFGDLTSGHYYLETNIYVEPGNGAYYNVLHSYGAFNEWGLEVFFSSNGTGYITAGGENAANFSYSTGEWTECIVDIDLDSDWAIFFVNGIQVYAWQWSLNAFNGNPGLCQLSAVDFFAHAPSGVNPFYYFDDVSLTIISKTKNNLTGYKVHLNDSYVDFTENLFWQYSGLTPGVAYTAGVSALYDEGESNIVEYEFTYDNGQTSHALQFDGTDDYVQVSDVSFPENDLTIQAWINPDIIEGTQEIVYWYGEYAGVQFRISETGSLLYGESFNGTWNYVVSADNIILPNVWTHVSITKQGNQCNLYVNGIHVGYNQFDENPLSTIISIGGRGNNMDRFFNGNIDEVRIWSVAQTQSEIQENMYTYLEDTETGLFGYWRMNEGTGQTAFDLSGNGYDGQLGSTPSVDNNDPAWIATNWPYIIPLQADFSADITSGEGPLTVNFTDLSTGIPTTWAWDFQNDGTVDSNDPNPEWTYADPGIYTVSLTVSNGTDQSDTEIKTDYVSVYNVVAGPLLTATWQTYTWPYNAYYPEDPAGINGYLGNACGPTAMALMMHYWGYPAQGSGSLSFTDTYGHFWSANFGETTYEWSNMPDYLPVNSTENEYAAIATLMYHAAVSMYDIYGSGRSLSVLTNSFKTYFNYSDQAECLFRDDYTPAEWDAIFKNELDNGRPIMIEGWTANSAPPGQTGNHEGHYFICDGYNSLDEYHIKWNYGNSEGYYPLYELGVFNAWNWIIVGFEPENLNANFSADVTSGDAPLTVNFTGLSTGGATTWEWDFQNDGTIDSYVQNSEWTYNNPGTYTVALTVSNGTDQSDTEIKTDYITVIPVGPTAGFTADVTSGNATLTVNFTDLTAQGSGLIDEWNWDFGDGHNSSDQNPVHIYETPGTYTVFLTVTDVYDLSDTETKVDYITVLSGGVHFNPVWETPYNPMTFYIVAATIDDADMQPGDEVGLFDIDPNTFEEICVGAGTLTQSLTGGIHLEIIASMDDGIIPGQANGFSPGHTILYRLWNETTGEITNVSSNYPYPGFDEVYTSQGSAFVELAGLLTVTQTINFATAWNIMSFRVEPENMDMLDIVQPLIDEEALYKVLDEAGGTIFHLPFPPPNGQWTNTIGNMATTEGYYVKIDSETTLQVTGSPVVTPLNIPLHTGWNIIAYPCQQPQDALAAVQSLIDAGVLHKVIDESGGTIFHLPFPPPNGQWTNTIGNFESGNGYYVNVSGEAILTLDCPTGKQALSTYIPEKIETSFFQPVFENNPYMPMNVILLPDENMMAGDEVGIFDGDVCVGATVFNGIANQPVFITVSADDPYTDWLDGYITGNCITAKSWTPQTNQISNIEIELIEGISTFEPLETCVGSIAHLLTDLIEFPNGMFDVKVQPNPFKNTTNIVLLLHTNANVKISIKNLSGVTVKQIHEQIIDKGQKVIKLNAIDMRSGVYTMLVEFTNQDRVIRKFLKVVII